MSTFRAKDGHTPPDDQPTRDLSPARGPATGSGHRARLALVGESGQHITSAIDDLLRRRLRIAVLITLAGFGAFLVRVLLEPGSHNHLEYQTRVFHTSVVAVMIVLTCVLWSTWPLSLRWLRVMELTLFGASAAFFLWLQFAVFHNGYVLRLANPDVPDSGERVLRLAAGGHSLRWFCLIVIYGVFIPNTWKRCALVVGLMALTPLVLTAGTCSH